MLGAQRLTNCQISLSEAVYVMQLFIINSKSKCNPFIFEHFSQCSSKAGQVELDNLHRSFYLMYMANLFLCLIFFWRLIDPKPITRKKLLPKSEIINFKAHPSLSKCVANLYIFTLIYPYAPKVQILFRSVLNFSAFLWDWQEFRGLVLCFSEPKS